MRHKDENAYGQQPKKRHVAGFIGRLVFRTLLLIVTAALLISWGIYQHLDRILRGPSPAARDRMAVSLMTDSRFAWLPGLFLDDKTLSGLEDNFPETDKPMEAPQETIPVNMELPADAPKDEWADYPEGIRIEKIPGETYQAYAMMIKDPSRVYLGLSNEELSPSKLGKRVNEAMESEGAVAAINSGAFFDNGTSDPEVGATPEGLVFSNGECAWKTGTPPSKGFAGFNKDNKLIVLAENIGKEKAEEMNIRDGCCFGPALMIDGKVCEGAEEKLPGRNPRTAIGQREDGTVIFLCIDGRQASSVGGNIADVIELMQKLGAVNACNMDGGSSTVMMYRDTEGRYGEAQKAYMVNSYSQLQANPRRMPDYWMVKPMKKEAPAETQPQETTEPQKEE